MKYIYYNHKYKSTHFMSSSVGLKNGIYVYIHQLKPVQPDLNVKNIVALASNY